LLALSIPAIFGGLIWLFYLLAVTGKLLEHPKRLEFAKERLNNILPDAKPDKAFFAAPLVSSKPVQPLKMPGTGAKRKAGVSGGNLVFARKASARWNRVDRRDQGAERVRTFSNGAWKGAKPNPASRTLVNVRFCYPKTRYGDARPPSRR